MLKTYPRWRIAAGPSPHLVVPAEAGDFEMFTEPEIPLQQDSSSLDLNDVGWRPSAPPKREDSPTAKLRQPSTLPGELSQISSHRPAVLPKASGRRQQAHSKEGIAGRVFGFNARSDAESWDPNIQVWTFRVIRCDEEENRLPLPPVIVEMRGHAFKGFLCDNDKVLLPGKYPEGQIIRTDRVHNLTTDTLILAKDPLRKWQRVNKLTALAAIGFFGLILLIIIGAVIGAIIL
jgi:hypothetical protein